MKKSTLKVLLKVISILLVVITVATVASTVLAASGEGSALNPKDLTPSYGNNDDMKNKAGKIMGIIRNVAVIASVIIIMVIGVKYILGSVEEKAEYKKTFMPLIIGIVLVVSATTIASFIFSNAE